MPRLSNCRICWKANLKLWLLSQLREPSTWRGAVWLLTAFGVSLRPEQSEAIIAAGMAMAGLLGVFLSDAQSTGADPVRGGDVDVRADVGANLPGMPEIELVGRATVPPVAAETGVDPDDVGARAVPVRPADRMHLSVSPHYPAEHDERSSGPGWNG